MHDASFDGWQTDVTEENSRLRFFVTSGVGREWLIYREGAMNPIDNYRRKTEAVDHAKLLARRQPPSQVLVEQKDGSFKVQFACEARECSLPG
jgi:Uncharacterized protein conserved in bacteria (DUF2188)